MKHFKQSVSEAVKARITALAEYALDNWDKVVTGNHESYGTKECSLIQGNHVSGWIPHQDGGYTITELYQSDIDSGSHFCAAQTESVNSQSDDCYKTFIDQNNLPEDSQYDDWPDDIQNQFADYESEWMSPALFSFDVFIEGDKVTTRTSINYRDAPYYREKYATDLKSVTYELAEFMAMSDDDIIKAVSV